MEDYAKGMTDYVEDSKTSIQPIKFPKFKSSITYKDSQSGPGSVLRGMHTPLPCCCSCSSQSCRVTMSDHNYACTWPDHFKIALYT